MWGNRYETNFMLHIVQNTYIYITYKVGIYIKLYLLGLVEQQTLLDMFKVKNREIPESLQKLFVFTST